MFVDLTQEINSMREELILQRTMQENPANPNPIPNPPPPPNVRNTSKNPLKYYPDINKLWKSLYLNVLETMEYKRAIEWL